MLSLKKINFRQNNPEPLVTQLLLHYRQRHHAFRAHVCDLLASDKRDWIIDVLHSEVACLCQVVDAH